MASNAARHPDKPAIIEHDVVRLCVILTADGAIPAGERGTVVHIHRGGSAFEVEFAAPFHVVTVMAENVERISA